MNGRFLLLLVATIAVAAATLACSNTSSQPNATSNEAPTSAESTAGSPTAPIDEWLAASSVPPAECQLEDLVSMRPDMAPALQLGPVYAALGTRLPVMAVNPRDPFLKILWVVDRQAGSHVVVRARAVTGHGELFFYYDEGGQEANPVTGSSAVQAGQHGTRQLEMRGPFDIQIDAARGSVRPTQPGCYELTAEWDAGSASASIYVYGSREECYPPCP